jgi:hypothetical protein
MCRAAKAVPTAGGLKNMTTIPDDADPIDDAPPELWGALADLMEPVEGVDLTEPVGETWAAEEA